MSASLNRRLKAIEEELAKFSERLAKIETGTPLKVLRDLEVRLEKIEEAPNLDRAVAEVHAEQDEFKAELSGKIDQALADARRARVLAAELDAYKGHIAIISNVIRALGIEIKAHYPLDEPMPGVPDNGAPVPEPGEEIEA